MKKINIQGYDFAYRIGDKDFPEKVQAFEGEESNSSIDAILKLVYAPDGRTGLPTGDLCYLVSDKANPQVKEFIKTQLLLDTSPAVIPAGKYNLSDDDLLALSRGTDEDLEAYVERLNTSIERDKWLIDNVKNNVSSKSSEPSVSSE